VSSPLRTGTLAPPPASVRDDPAAGATWYREDAPARLVAAVVACRWAGSGGWARSLRLLPDGCADLVWDGHGLHVVGALPSAARLAVGAETRNVGLRLRPGAAGAVLGCPASELPAAPVRLDAVWGPGARRLEARLARAAGAAGTSAVADRHRPVAPADPSATGACASAGVGDLHRLLEAAVADRLGRSGAPDPAVVAAADLLRRPAASVDAVAAAVGWSPRELRRRFPAHAGLGPKALHRVLRFRRFVGHLPAVAGGRASLAAVAARCGYADQSHLGRECRRLSGSTPAALVARWSP
jgi:AraC-like DNA-binding protein